MICKKKLTKHSEYNELLILPVSTEKNWERFVISLLRFLGVFFVFLGVILLVLEIYTFLNFPAKVGQPSIAKSFEVYSDLITATISLMGFGGLLFSVAHLANQIKIERENYIQKDMPVVFIAPKLLWELSGLSKNRHILVKELYLYLGVLNVGDCSATRVNLKTNKLIYSNGDQEYDLLGELNYHKKITLDFLQAKHIQSRDVTIRDYQQLVKIDLTKKCPDLLDAIIRGNTAGKYSYIELYFDVSFMTIRQLEFHSTARVVWSPKHCREVENKSQRELIEKFEKTLKDKGAPIDIFMQKDADNPLSPIIYEK